MTITQDIKTDRYGTPDQAPPIDSQPMGANAIVYGGTVAIARAGFVVPSDSPLSTDEVLGIVDKQTDNRTGSFYGGATGAAQCPIDRGAFWLAYDTMTQANGLRQNVYLVDGQTVSLSTGGGTRPLAGVVLAVDTTISKCAVALSTNPAGIF